MATSTIEPTVGAYAKWQRTVADRYKDRSFVAQNRSGLEIEPVYQAAEKGLPLSALM